MKILQNSASPATIVKARHIKNLILKHTGRKLNTIFPNDKAKINLKLYEKTDTTT